MYVRFCLGIHTVRPQQFLLFVSRAPLVDAVVVVEEGVARRSQDGEGAELVRSRVRDGILVQVCMYVCILMQNVE